MESLMETSNDSYVCSHLQNSSQAANLHLNEKVVKTIPKRLYTYTYFDQSGTLKITYSDALYVFKVKSMKEAGLEVYHLAFGQSPFPIPNCFVEALKKHAASHEYLPVTGM